MALQFEPFAPDHLPDAASLLAARHRANRVRDSDLPAAYEASAACAQEIRATLDRPGASGIVALREGRLMGFLLGVPQLPAPNGGPPFIFQRRAISMPGAAYAAEQAEGAELYRRLYAEAAPGWLAQGYFDHYAGVPVRDESAREAWESQGFGRDLAWAVRDTRVAVKTDGRGTPEIAIRRAGPEDIEDVFRLIRDNLRYHAGPPVFFPFFPEAWPPIYDSVAQELADPAFVLYLALRNGRAVALQTFVPARPSIQTPEAAVDLDHGYTKPEARGTGIATGLLAHGIRWAHETGYERCVLAFAPANLLSARFWLGHGFRPLQYRMARRVDERMAWANG